MGNVLGSNLKGNMHRQRPWHAIVALSCKYLENWLEDGDCSCQQHVAWTCGPGCSALLLHLRCAPEHPAGCRHWAWSATNPWEYAHHPGLYVTHQRAFDGGIPTNLNSTQRLGRNLQHAFTGLDACGCCHHDHQRCLCSQRITQFIKHRHRKQR